MVVSVYYWVDHSIQLGSLFFPAFGMLLEGSLKPGRRPQDVPIFFYHRPGAVVLIQHT